MHIFMEADFAFDICFYLHNFTFDTSQLLKACLANSHGLLRYI